MKWTAPLKCILRFTPSSGQCNNVILAMRFAFLHLASVQDESAAPRHCLPRCRSFYLPSMLIKILYRLGHGQGAGYLS